MTDQKIPALDYQPTQYEVQLQRKTATVEQQLSPFYSGPIHVFSSPKKHFRMRAEFRVWHQSDAAQPRCFYAMFDPEQPKQAIEITDFPIASRAISDLMPILMEKINQSKILMRKLFQIEFLSCSRDEVLVSLIYHRQLDEHWIVAAQELESALNIAIIGRARKQRIVLSRDEVTEQLTVAGENYRYQQKENSFTQPNAAINQQMIGWTCQQIAALQQHDRETTQDLLELYCGNGNFTIPLAKKFRRVLATEISKTSIASAKENCRLNAVDNIDFVRLSSEETVSALRKERPFRRLSDIALDDYRFSTLLLDPPRAGLDDASITLAKTFDTVVYISCNPASLVENLQHLTAQHRVAAAALFDQFPYSRHCECGVILQREEAPPS